MSTEVKLSRYAQCVIEAYFDVGAGTRFNKIEQLAALGGTIRKGVINVDLVLPLLSMSASCGHVEIKAEQWFAAMQTFSRHKLKLVGSIHSHPQELGLFLSGADKETHSQMFPNGASLVINPQKRVISAFHADGERFPLKLRKEVIYGKKSNLRNPDHSGVRLCVGNGSDV